MRRGQGLRNAGLPLIVALCAALAVALRLPFIGGDLTSDESGLLLVARGWDPGPGRLYGDYWVDRPPLLIGLFWLAGLLPGTIGVRLLGCAAAGLLAACAAVAGHAVRGRRGAWAAGLTAVVASSFTIAGHQANGMVQGTALEMASCCALLVGRRLGGRGLLVGAAVAGACGVGALAIKQSLAGGLVFALVVVVTAWWTDRRDDGAAQRPRDAALALTGLVVGAGATLLLVVGWSWSAGVDLAELWYALYGFRVDAAEAIAGANTSAPRDRFVVTSLLGVVSGLVVVVVVFLAALPRLWADRPRRPEVLGTVALLAVAVVGMVVGGSWWAHYLAQLVPAACLMAALVVPAAIRQARAMQLVVVGVVASALVSTVVGAVVLSQPSQQVAVGRAVADVADPGDTVVVLYGAAETVLYAGLPSDYPDLWSLPTRVHDPELERLEALVDGPRAPTWVIEMIPVDSWGIDADGDLRRALARHYRVAATPCGVPVLVLRDVSRGAPEVDVCGRD